MDVARSVDLTILLMQLSNSSGMRFSASGGIASLSLRASNQSRTSSTAFTRRKYLENQAMRCSTNLAGNFSGVRFLAIPAPFLRRPDIY
jgi:hypothetical protein